MGLVFIWVTTGGDLRMDMGTIRGIIPTMVTVTVMDAVTDVAVIMMIIITTVTITIQVTMDTVAQSGLQERRQAMIKELLAKNMKREPVMPGGTLAHQLRVALQQPLHPGVPQLTMFGDPFQEDRLPSRIRETELRELQLMPAGKIRPPIQRVLPVLVQLPNVQLQQTSAQLTVQPRHNASTSIFHQAGMRKMLPATIKTLIATTARIT
jgi:hypothetical protein